MVYDSQIHHPLSGFKQAFDEVVAGYNAGVLLAVTKEGAPTAYVKASYPEEHKDIFHRVTYYHETQCWAITRSVAGEKTTGTTVVMGADIGPVINFLSLQVFGKPRPQKKLPVDNSLAFLPPIV